jgi:hypothetical protein
MSKREIVLLVSRAVAMLTIITALIDLFINLPYQMFLLYHQLHIWQTPYSSTHFPVWAGFIVGNMRVAALFIVAGLFWRCGPTIERLFLPAETQEQSDTPQ